ncbi:MAG: hypothetical protein DMG42_25595, partial [Acidobacteria bacterium]
YAKVRKSASKTPTESQSNPCPQGRCPCTGGQLLQRGILALGHSQKMPAPAVSSYGPAVPLATVRTYFAFHSL